LRSDLGTDAVGDGVAHVFALDDALLKSVAFLHDESEVWLAHKALGVEAIESAVFVDVLLIFELTTVAVLVKNGVVATLAFVVGSASSAETDALRSLG